MKNVLSKIAILAMTVFLGACASVGPAEITPVTMPNGEHAAIVLHNQSAPDWMLRRGGLRLNYIVRGDVSATKDAVAEAERVCRKSTKMVRPNNFVSVLSETLLYAAAGYVGVGYGARAFVGTVPHQYAVYGAWATGMAGAANGIITLGGQTYTFENCGREILDLFPAYDVRVLQKSPY